MSPTKIISEILKKYYLFNEKTTEIGNSKVVSYGGARGLNGTINFFIDNTTNEVFLKCKILTDVDMYESCLELVKFFKDDVTSSFKPIPLFYESFGTNGLINVNILLNEINLTKLDTLMSMNEIEKKVK